MDNTTWKLKKKKKKTEHTKEVDETVPLIAIKGVKKVKSHTWIHLEKTCTRGLKVSNGNILTALFKTNSSSHVGNGLCMNFGLTHCL